jgi:serine phosphatase RsbU (regulator of sigma subunit)
MSAGSGERDALLRDALAARAQAEAAQERTETALREAEASRAQADAARARHEFLGAAGRAMAASMDYRATLAEVAEAAVPVIADWCVVLVVRGDGQLETIAIAQPDARRRERAWEFTHRFPPRIGAPVGAANVIRTGRPELLQPIRRAHRMAAALGDSSHYEAITELAAQASLIVALKTPTRVLGAISFVIDDPGRAFAREDVEVALSLAARAGLHVQNALLYAERSHVARTLERSLLPAELPRIPGVELAARYRSADAQSEVGGDFYDVVAAGDDWVAFVGDVCGKGAEAAALTSLTRYTLLAAALQGNGSLDALRLANSALLARGGALRFATLAHVRLRPLGMPDGGGVHVELVNAGHPPPLVLRAGGAVEETSAGGTVLGVVDDPVFDEQWLHLEPGDLLLLHTDGLTELRGRRDPDFGPRELRRVLRAYAGAEPAVLVAEAERRAVELQQGRARDDMAILAVRAAV